MLPAKPAGLWHSWLSADRGMSGMSKPLNPWKLTGYKAGQNVVCKVTGIEPGGYAVIIPKDNLPGFLPSEQKLKVGEEVLAQFVCVHNNRILLSSRFSGSTAGPSGHGPNLYAPQAQTQSVRWQDQLGGVSQPGPLQTQPEQDVAFNTWAQGAPQKFHLKRATDLIVPPIDGATPNTFKIADYDLQWLITDLEGGMRTGCVKAASQDRLSRSAMLLYRGRAVGCIYGCKSMNDTYPTEQSLVFMMSDLGLPETQVSIYDLPEEVTLALSALFLGYPVQRSDDLDARSYMDYLLNWFAEKGQTACLAFSLQRAGGTCLALIHKGQYVGAFYVEDQKFVADRSYVYELLDNDAGAGVEASILPPEMTSSAVRFGFSLSMVLKRS